MFLFFQSCALAQTDPYSSRGNHLPTISLRDLIGSTNPQSIVSIDLDLYSRGYLQKPRIAILNPSGLHIYREVNKGAFAEEFMLKQPPIPWGHMQSFPSTSRLFGVVLWGTEEESYSPATVVCYAGNEFRVVFRSENATFADLDFDGTPEILVSHYNSAVAKEPIKIDIWVWNGESFVSVVTVAPSQLWSEEVVNAVRKVAR